MSVSSVSLMGGNQDLLTLMMALSQSSASSAIAAELTATQDEVMASLVAMSGGSGHSLDVYA